MGIQKLVRGTVTAAAVAGAAAAAVALAAMATHAGERDGGGIEVGEIVRAGNGCSAVDTVTLDPETGELRMRLRGYTAELEGPAGPVARKTCNLAVPISAPAGYRVVIARAGLFANAVMEQGAVGIVRLEAFLAGGQGPVEEQAIDSETHSELSRVEIGGDVGASTECGGQAIVRMNTSAVVDVSAGAGAYGMISVRKAGLGLSLVPCE